MPAKKKNGNLVLTFHAAAQVLCGHVNKQFINRDGVQEDLACTLPKGHTLDHFAKHERLVEEKGLSQEGREAVLGTHVEAVDGYWSDGAGNFPKTHAATPEEDFARLKKSRQAERGTDDALSEKIDTEVRNTFGG